MSEDKEENTDIEINGNNATWHIRAEGDILGTYAGKFIFKCALSPLEQLAAGREERAMLGSNMALATDHERLLAYALSQLKYRIVVAPPFWQQNSDMAGDLIDENILGTVLDASIRAQNKYKEELKKRKEEAIARAKSIGDKIKKEQEESAPDEEEEDEG